MLGDVDNVFHQGDYLNFGMGCSCAYLGSETWGKRDLLVYEFRSTKCAFWIKFRISEGFGV